MSLMLAAGEVYVPNLFWVWPFVAILLAIAILPLLKKTHHWWEENKNKLIVALALAAVTLLYYGLRGTGVPEHGDHGDEAHAAEVDHGQAAHGDGHGAQPPADEHPVAEHPADAETQPSEDVPVASSEAAAVVPHMGAVDEHPVHARTDPGWDTVLAVLNHAVLKEYVPFIVLLFSLYVIAGGIVVRGDVEATPLTNTAIIGTGGLLASFIGTTGSAMVLIRFLLKTNSERRYKVHTIVFFIFVAANIGGMLLPIGDPPLFLGYLRGVDFFWTLNLWSYWLVMMIAALVVYFIWDTWAHSRESAKALKLDHTQIQRMHVAGLLNVLWLLGVVGAVATLDPSKPFPGTHWHAPPYMREGVQLLMALLSWITTSIALRKENQFNFVAIGEVACLFIGIFITMQVPIEILQTKGAELGLDRPWHFFWATGILSSFLDNAPTYVVYFETAGTITPQGMELMHGVATASGTIPIPLLIAISCGAVFMGANSYIGNGPNFMVKAIAEQSGVRMPSFFGYMVYSGLILIPLFVVITFIFFRG